MSAAVSLRTIGNTTRVTGKATSQESARLPGHRRRSSGAMPTLRAVLMRHQSRHQH